MHKFDADARCAPLVAHHGAIGDLIQLTAMLQVLHERWGEPCDLLAGGCPAPTILASLPFVGTVQTLSTRKRPFYSSPEQWQLVRWLEFRQPSPCYVYERWRHRVAPWSDLTRLEWLLHKAGIPRSRWITTEDRSRHVNDHAVDYQLELAHLTPAAFAPRAPTSASTSPRPRLAVSPAELAACRDWLGSIGWRGEPLILIQAAARRAQIRGAWPAESWTRLARELLLRQPEAWLLFIGGPQERKRTAELAAAVGDTRARSVADDLPLRRLFGLLTLADSCISVDTGPAHAAAALDCPLVVLLGVAHPRRNRPLGPPERIQLVAAWGSEPWPTDPPLWYQTHEMAAIRVSQVVEAWERLS